MTQRSKFLKSQRPASLAVFAERLEFAPESDRVALDRSGPVVQVVVTSDHAQTGRERRSLAGRVRTTMHHGKNERRVRTALAVHKKEPSRLLPDLKKVNQRRTPWLKECR
jgi:hypothetical protein